jgi:hypothetical protein
MKIIHIKRKPYEGRIPKQFIMESSSKIGGAIDENGNLLKGITFAEEKKWLPAIVGVLPESPEFSNAVKTYYKDLAITVPVGGAKLNITLDEYGEPVHVDDYLKYKFLLANKRVAKSEEELKHNRLAEYYLFDTEQRVADANKKVQASKLAGKEFLKVSADVDKTRRVLTIMHQYHGQVIKNMTDEEVENLLYDLSIKHPVEFHKIAVDKDLALRSDIEEMISLRVLTKIGNRIINIDEMLGEDINEVVIYLKDPKNSGVLANLKARADEAKKG